MKKFVAMLLVLTMVLALAGTAAMAAVSPLVGKFVVVTADTNAYSAAKSSKKTSTVAMKGSVGLCVATCGKFAKVIVNKGDGTFTWFKKCDLAVTDTEAIIFVWAKGGKGMSRCTNMIFTDKAVFNGKVKVKAHTNLRKNPGMKFKSQGVVEKCDMLKLTGRYGYDNRPVAWLEVCKKGKKLWISSAFVELTALQKTVLVYVPEIR